MAVLLCGSTLGAQVVTLGVKADLPLRRGIQAIGSGYTAETTPAVLGPFGEVKLPWHLAVETEIMFRWMRYNNDRHASRWEIPLLLKWRATVGGHHPFVSLGGTLNGVRVSAAPELRHRHALGMVCGGGLEFRLGALRLAPELRYTHWGERNFGTRTSPLHSVLDQVDLLVGLAWGLR